MKIWLQDYGVDDWFYQFFVWFGSCILFKGFDGLCYFGGFNLVFYFGKQCLEEGMLFIFDCVLIFGVYIVDVGYFGVLGYNLLQEWLMDDLLIY